jgi:hypothetical protein
LVQKKRKKKKKKEKKKEDFGFPKNKLGKVLG